MAQYVVDEAPFMSGLAAARAERERFNEDQKRALRYQELQSEAAYRKVLERQVAQNTALKLAEANRQIQNRADLAKSVEDYRSRVAPFSVFQVPDTEDPTRTSSIPVPNPHQQDRHDALMDTVATTLFKQGDPRAVGLMRDIAYDKMTQGRFDQAEATANWQNQRGDVTRYGTDVRAATADKQMKSREQIAYDKMQNDFNLLDQKFQNQQEILDLHGRQQVNLERMREKARMDLAKGETSGIAWVNRHLNTIAKDLGGTVAGARMSTEERNKAAQDIAWNGWLRAKAQMDEQKSKEQPGATSDAAPEEDVWVLSPPDKNGKRIKGTIPKSELEKAKKKGYTEFEG